MPLARTTFITLQDAESTAQQEGRNSDQIGRDPVSQTTQYPNATGSVQNGHRVGKCTGVFQRGKNWQKDHLKIATFLDLSQELNSLQKYYGVGLVVGRKLR